jgi:TonB family protein
MRLGSIHLARCSCLTATLAALSCATTQDVDSPKQGAELATASVDPVRYCAESLSHPAVPSADTPGLHWPPRVLQRAETVYPRVASLDGREGMVKVRLWITATGAIDKIDVVQSSGWTDLDGEAVRSLRLGKFAPACSTAGEPVAATYVVAKEFSLLGR